MKNHLLPATEVRVLQNTDRRINERNRRRIEHSVAAFAGASSMEIEARLRELDEEWDIERALEANAATVVLLSLGLAAAGSRRWLMLTGAVGSFLLQHALQGWCPPLPILRRLGIRTIAEINEEKTALRVLRGDFQQTQSPGEAIAQVRRAMVPPIVL